MEQYKYTNELQHFGRRGMKWGQNIYKKEESSSGRAKGKQNTLTRNATKSNPQNKAKVTSFMSKHNITGKLKTVGKATAIGAAFVASAYLGKGILRNFEYSPLAAQTNAWRAEGHAEILKETMDTMGHMRRLGRIS